jgi:general secretion pathway protein G
VCRRHLPRFETACRREDACGGNRREIETFTGDLQMRTYRSQRGFTLVEILIVVIILGILAAIVIPQFTSASQDARKNSLASQLQTLRSQIELYKLQHLDQPPPSLVAGGANAWAEMIARTTAIHQIGGDTATINTHPFGPYVQQIPRNPLNGFSSVKVVAESDVALGSQNGDAGVGFVFSSNSHKLWGTSKSGAYIYDEIDPTNPNNDL